VIIGPIEANEREKNRRGGSIVGPTAFALVILGTAGLLTNAFVSDLGNGITPVFAAMSRMGLIGVGIQPMRR
jgi:hypothetical protein